MHGTISQKHITWYMDRNLESGRIKKLSASSSFFYDLPNPILVGKNLKNQNKRVFLL
jgi:hypothetical protein